LLNDTKASQQVGLSIDHIGFTPNNIASPEIQLGDRPFASAIMLKSFKINTNAERKSQLISALRLGLISPGAFGKEMQVGIHEATGNTIPQGWQNQIKNDAVVNYQVLYQKELIALLRFFSLQYEASANIEPCTPMLRRPWLPWRDCLPIRFHIPTNTNFKSTCMPNHNSIL
jgi:lipid A 3-O-deacylase